MCVFCFVSFLSLKINKIAHSPVGNSYKNHVLFQNKDSFFLCIVYVHIVSLHYSLIQLSPLTVGNGNMIVVFFFLFE
jgi:hypothetical protein